MIFFGVLFNISYDIQMIVEKETTNRSFFFL